MRSDLKRFLRYGILYTVIINLDFRLNAKLTAYTASKSAIESIFGGSHLSVSSCILTFKQKQLKKMRNNKIVFYIFLGFLLFLSLQLNLLGSFERIL